MHLTSGTEIKFKDLAPNVGSPRINGCSQFVYFAYVSDLLCIVRIEQTGHSRVSWAIATMISENSIVE